MCVQIFGWTRLHFSGVNAQEGKAQPRGSCMYNFVTNCQVALEQLYVLPSHQQCVRDPVSLRPCQHLVVSVVFILATLTDEEWRWTSFHMLLHYLTLLFDETSLQGFYLFLIGLFNFFTVAFWKVFMFFRYLPFVRHVVCDHSLLLCSVTFHPLRRVFHRENYKLLMRSNLLAFFPFYGLWFSWQVWELSASSHILNNFYLLFFPKSFPSFTFYM